MVKSNTAGLWLLLVMGVVLCLGACLKSKLPGDPS